MSSLISSSFHSFLTAVESRSDSFHPKSFLCSICSQQSSLVAFQLWSGVPFGQLNVLSLWSVTEMPMLKNRISAFWTKGCCLHFIVESCIVVCCTLFMQDGAPCHTSKKTKDWLAKERIKCLPWSSQLPDMNLIENLWTILDRAL